jgi:hypothetical protein
LRKYLIAAPAAVGAIAFASVAFGQAASPTHTLTAAVAPKDAGTATKPKPSSIAFKVVNTPEDRTTAAKLEVFFPKNVRLSTAGFKTCSAEKMNAERTDAGCPKGSKIGAGAAKAHVGEGGTRTNIQFVVAVYAASKGNIVIWLDDQTLEVDVAFPGKMTKASGKFGQKLTINIPAALQQPGPGLFSELDELGATINAKVRKNGRVYSVISTTGCPKNKKWPIQSRLTYNMERPLAPLKATSTTAIGMPCKK